jgi:hypothetical protein
MNSVPTNVRGGMGFEPADMYDQLGITYKLTKPTMTRANRVDDRDYVSAPDLSHIDVRRPFTEARVDI